MQDEKKRLQEENERLESETTDLKKEIDELKVRLEETEWGLCQKSGELAHVKSQLKDTQVRRYYMYIYIDTKKCKIVRIYICLKLKYILMQEVS